MLKYSKITVYYVSFRTLDLAFGVSGILKGRVTWVFATSLPINSTLHKIISNFASKAFKGF